ncbi:MAG: hypothetical protein M1820_004244 [Bogoriella megaspora]|nr:MAG: hypothetical protein M1820_004244 [Bogoriella megaspora]
MYLNALLTLSAPVFVAALANPAITPAAVADYQALEERAGTTPTPTGTACTATTSPAPVSPSLIAQAVAGCVGVLPAGTNDTRNDIVNGVCKPFTLIFARGTSEDPNLGNLVGPPFIYALNATFGTKNVAVQGVNNYPASVPEFCIGGSPSGSQNLAQLISQTRTKCPKTKLSVSGYSQGAQVVHNAASQLSAADTAFVNSVILFGDPDNGKPVGKIPSYKVSTDCHAGDNICAGGETILEPHLSYCRDVAVEAAFAKARSLASN